MGIETLTGAHRWSVPQDGECVMHLGRVWITRDGEAQDHVLDAGARLRVRRGEALVMEPWTPGQAAQWRFEAGGSVRRQTSAGMVSRLAMMLMAAGRLCRGWALRLDPGLLTAD